ncbi:MAG: maltokinase N-terminal cap-like domain-containing protein [Terriglobales bacterium]
MAPTGERELAEWMARQRWYGAKSAAIAGLRVAEQVKLGDGAGLALVEVTAEGQAAACYALPEYGGAEGLESEAVRRRWFTLLAERAERQGANGSFVFEVLQPLKELDRSRLLGAEQSNTSVLFRGGQSAWILKLFRRVQAGENPDFEIPRALAEHTLFRNVPAAAGRVLYRPRGGEAATIAVLQAFVANQGDGWEYVLARLRDGSAAALVEDLTLLGRRTAELHCALAAIQSEADFAPEPITADDEERWRARARAGVAAAGAGDAVLLEPWRRALEFGRAGLQALEGCDQIRIHGDYHLGQTLKAEGDFYLFDFEGEPARPLAERRRKGTVLQDVAGMLRSLGYAAHAAGKPEWEAGARAAFLGAYRRSVTAAPLRLVPERGADFLAACRFFECEKAVYELAYERNHRPQWVGIPLAALRRMLTEE